MCVCDRVYEFERKRELDILKWTCASGGLVNYVYKYTIFNA